MLIKDLPEVIKKRALECAEQQGRVQDENKSLSGANLAFTWAYTSEKNSIWQEVDNGNFQPFYDFHKISPVAEWVPKEGEIVEISENEQIWLPRIFVYHYKDDYICESGDHSKGYSRWRYIRKFPRLTRTEIAEKFGVRKDFEFVEE